MNYARFITSLSARRKPSLIRELTKVLATAPPDTIVLSGGYPNPQMFPYKEVDVTLNDGSSIKISGSLMKAALQYSPTQGLPELVSQLKEIQKLLHKPPHWEETELVVTAGSQDGLCKTLEMLMTPGATVIVEEPLYSGTLAILNPYKPHYIAVATDKDGMRPDLLREALSKRWKPEDVEADETAPKVMYLNPNGSNPSGAQLTAARKREIYQIAHDYNILILEDDPYYFLQFGKEQSPTFLSLDVDGRVIRFDSFSKVLSAGLRVGFITGPKPLIQRVVLHMQVSVLHSSALSQVMMSQLLKQWKFEGYMDHVKQVQNFYRHKRDIMVAAAKKHLTGLCEWYVPEGGMFIWMKTIGIEDTWDMVMERGLQKRLMLLPGRAFYTDSSKPCPYLRAAYSIASEEDIHKGFQRLAELIREEWKIEGKKA